MKTLPLNTNSNIAHFEEQLNLLSNYGEAEFTSKEGTFFDGNAKMPLFNYSAKLSLSRDTLLEVFLELQNSEFDKKVFLDSRGSVSQFSCTLKTKEPIPNFYISDKGILSKFVFKSKDMFSLKCKDETWKQFLKSNKNLNDFYKQSIDLPEFSPVVMSRTKQNVSELSCHFSSKIGSRILLGPLYNFLFEVAELIGNNNEKSNEIWLNQLIGKFSEFNEFNKNSFELLCTRNFSEENHLKFLKNPNKEKEEYSVMNDLVHYIIGTDPIGKQKLIAIYDPFDLWLDESLIDIVDLNYKSENE